MVSESAAIEAALTKYNSPADNELQTKHGRFKSSPPNALIAGNTNPPAPYKTDANFATSGATIQYKAAALPVVSTALSNARRSEITASASEPVESRASV